MNKLQTIVSRVSRKQPIIGVAAGSGQVVRCAVEAGTDLLLALNASVYRNQGVGSLASFLPFANANLQTLTLLEEQVLPRSGNLPVVAGVFSADPTLDRAKAFARLKKLGVEGVVNWPAIGFVDGRFRESLEAEGMGLEAEAAMLEEARTAGLFTFGFALEDRAVRRFVAAGVDAMILDAGLTRQIADIREKRDQLQQAIARLNKMLRISRQLDPSRVCLVFGGPITTVEDFEELLRHCDADGFAGGSVFERLPVQNIVVSTVRQFKSIPLERPVPEPQHGPGGLVGNSLPMQELFGVIRRIAPYLVNVCIEGESGTGKELVASLIHRLSNRSPHAFIAMNCGSIPDTLLESELFGHEKGSFTGADRRRLGKFELANHGTLLLDEVGDLSPRGQVALLRAIQQREIMRIGGSQPIPVNVRILAASNRRLENLVEEGLFRADLYFRLNNITVTLPPLRDRKEDIPLLVDHFLSRLSVQLNRKLISLSASFYKRLAQHSWPGNVRELESVICRTALLEDGPILEGRGFTPQGDSRVKAVEPPLDRDKQLRANLIHRALEAAEGNKSRAAASLKISRKTLYKWMQEI
jgi:DNA-binding NtrC family response regulator/predicted TIM-barrel enzyme